MISKSFEFAQNRHGFGHFYMILTRFGPKSYSNPILSGFDFPNLAIPYFTSEGVLRTKLT